MAAAARVEMSPSSSLDLAKPENTVYALLKLMGDVGGSRTWLLQHGRIHGVEQGGRTRHLLNYTGLTTREIRRIAASRFVSRYAGWMLFRDPLTDAPIDSWVNPFTDERVTVEHFVTKIGRQVFSASGLERPSGFEGTFTWFDRPFRLPWQIIGDDIWAPYEQFTTYRDATGHDRYELAIHTYLGKLSQLTDASSSAPASVASQSQSPFFWWMKQPDNGTHLILHSVGRKLASRSEIPPSVAEELERRFPGIMTVRFDG
jgi:hypothetical protein